MRIRATALLLVFFLWPAEAQSDSNRRPSIWDDPINFVTKNQDKCTMLITGQGENTNLRLSCQQGTRSYWCDYAGKPHTCSAYNKNPRHYFVQLMWTLRKLPNACRGPRQLKSHMCRKSADESLMVFQSASIPQPGASYRTAARPSQQSARSQTAQGHHARPIWKTARPLKRVKTTQRSSPTPTAPPTESTPKRMARHYCWRSLQGICSVVIGWFRN